MGAEELKPILNNCTHLVYGYVGIQQDKFNAISLNPLLDYSGKLIIKEGLANFLSITSLKKEFPHLSILLSVGGDVDIEKPQKYLNVVSITYKT